MPSSASSGGCICSSTVSFVRSSSATASSDAKVPNRRPHQRRHHGRRAERRRQIAAQRADVRAAAAFDRQLQLRILVPQDLEPVDRNRPRRQFELLAAAGQVVRPLAADLDRRVGRRPLQDVAEELRQRRFDLGPRRLRRIRDAARPRPRCRPSRCGGRAGTRPGTASASAARTESAAWPGRRRSPARRSPADRACPRGRTSPCWNSRSTRFTTSRDVSPAGLSTLRIPKGGGACTLHFVDSGRLSNRCRDICDSSTRGLASCTSRSRACIVKRS